MAISPAQAQRERAALLRAIERDLRSKDRARLLALRETIRGHRRAQREAIRRARATCARRRDVPSQAQVLSWQRQAKRDARAACDADLSAARKLADPVARSRAEHAAERAHQRQLKAIERGLRDRERRRPGVRRAVRRQESDDEVRGNIPPELVHLFERVKRQIRGTDRKSRTEAFLEYVQEHPDEQWQGLEDRADEVIRELERRQAMPNPKKKKKHPRRKNARPTKKAQRRTKRQSPALARARADARRWRHKAQSLAARRKSNPRRPPKRWFDRCLASVTAQKYARDPAAVCGAQWWRMPPHERAAIVHRWERGSPRQRRLAVAVAKAERNRTLRGRKKKTRR